jgi:hypothetical protein
MHRHGGGRPGRKALVYSICAYRRYEPDNGPQPKLLWEACISHEVNTV